MTGWVVGSAVQWGNLAVVLRVVDRLIWVIERTFAYAFIVAVGLNFFNVVGRYGFGITILSADELQIFILVFMAVSRKQQLKAAQSDELMLHVNDIQFADARVDAFVEVAKR